MRRYVQCCNSAYAPQGLALLRSLMRHEPDQAAWLMEWVCMDEDLYLSLLRLTRRDPSIGMSLRPLRWVDMVGYLPRLAGCLYDRTITEWFWTQASQAVYWRLVAPETQPEDVVVYLDSDLFFMADPSPVFAEIPETADVALHTHRFHTDYVDREARGHFNVGLCAFRANDGGHVAARWWSERVMELCRTEMPELRYKFTRGSGYDEWVRPAGSAGDQGWIEGLAKIIGLHEWNRPDIAISPYSYDWNDLPETIRWAHLHEYRFDRAGNCVKRTGYPTSAETERRLVEPWLTAVREAAGELNR